MARLKISISIEGQTLARGPPTENSLRPLSLQYVLPPPPRIPFLLVSPPSEPKMCHKSFLDKNPPGAVGMRV